MRKVIMIGCDLHDKTMLLKIAEGHDEPSTQSVKNTKSSRPNVRCAKELRLSIQNRTNLVATLDR